MSCLKNINGEMGFFKWQFLFCKGCHQGVLEAEIFWKENVDQGKDLEKLVKGSQFGVSAVGALQGVNNSCANIVINLVDTF